MKGWTEVRKRPQYPSWPAPIRKLQCDSCDFRVELTKSGRDTLATARSIMRRHRRLEHKA